MATLITNFFVTGPFQDKTAGAAASAKIDDAYNLTMFNPSYGIGPDLILAIIVAILLGLLLMRTPWGAEGQATRRDEPIRRIHGCLRQGHVDAGPDGLRRRRRFAGALYVIGPNGGRFLQAFSPGFGFLAITVALLARLNPWASLVAALFYATMMGGTTGLQSAGVPFPIVNVLQGLIIITITATFIINRSRRKKRLSKPEPVQRDKADMRGVSR